MLEPLSHHSKADRRIIGATFTYGTGFVQRHFIFLMPWHASQEVYTFTSRRCRLST